MDWRFISRIQKIWLDHYPKVFEGNFSTQISPMDIACNYLFIKINSLKVAVLFIREIEGTVLPIEIKSGWVTQAKSIKVFAEKYNPPYRIILSGRDYQIDHKNKVHFYSL